MLTIGGVAYSMLAFGFAWDISNIWASTVGVVALYRIDSIADALQFKFMENSVMRVSYYGWFLLAGLAMQIYASITHLGIT